MRISGSHDTVSPTGNSGLLRCRIFGSGSRKVRAAPPIPAGDLRIVCTAKHSLRSSVGRAATASRHPSGVVLWMSGSRHRQIVVTFGRAGELPGGNRTRLTAVSRTHLKLQKLWESLRESGYAKGEPALQLRRVDGSTPNLSDLSEMAVGQRGQSPACELIGSSRLPAISPNPGSMA